MKNIPTRARPFICQPRLIGAEARRLLAPGFSGKVLAGLSKTIYLSGSKGEILWVIQEGLPVHRRCVLSSFPLSSICAGQPFFVHGNNLQLGRELLVDLNQAEEWKASPIGTEKTAPLTNVMASVRQLLVILQVLDSGDGLGPVIQLTSSIANDRAFPPFPTHSLAARVASPILKIARACLGQNIGQVSLLGRELVGLGPGLTPSGDDFLGGLFFVARSLKMVYPQEFRWEEGPIGDLAAWTRTRTHPLSHVILGDLAQGHGPEALHDLVAGLLGGDGLDRVMGGVTRLLNIGQTSGWDMLAGVLTGMLLVEGKLKGA